VTVLAVPFHGNTVMFLPYPGDVERMLEVKDEYHNQQDTETGEQNPPEGEVDSHDEYDDIVIEGHSTGIKGWWARRRKRRWDRESKSDKFLKRLPNGIQRMRVLYPKSMSYGDVIEQLHEQVEKSLRRNSRRKLAYLTALPFAIILDLFTLCFVFTITDIILLSKNNNRLNQGRMVEGLVRRGYVTLEPSMELDNFYRRVQESPFQMPDNHTVDGLCATINAQPLAKTILKVRNAKAHRLGIKRSNFEQHRLDYPMPQGQQNGYSQLEDVLPPPVYTYDEF